MLLASLPASLAEAKGAGLRPYQLLIERMALRHRLQPELLAALVEVESARNAGATSSAGARGLGQLMPETARRFGVKDVSNPEDNLEGAARYLKWLLARYEGDVELALAAYNAGEGAVDRFSGVPPFPETSAFVRKVMKRAGLVPGSAGSSSKRLLPRPARLLRAKTGRLVITNR